MALPFICNLTVIQIIGSPKHIIGGGTTISAYWVDLVPSDPTSGSIIYNPNGNCLSLNGASNISLLNLPVGFNLLAITGIHRVGESTGSLYYGYFGHRITEGEATATVKLVTNVPVTYHPTVNVPSFNLIPQPTIPLSPTPDTSALFEFFRADISVKLTGVLLDGFTFAAVEDSLQYFGFYQIINNSYNIANPGPYAPGDNVTITATSSLDTINGINLIYFDPGTGLVNIISISQFISQSPTQLIFEIPANNPPTNTFIVEGVSNGTQFSGTVVLGSLSVLITNGSGVYQIVPGKTSDTIYTNSPVGSTTVELKIPDPFGKTGFIGG